MGKFRFFFSLLALVGPLIARPATERPNIVLIYLDDSGFGDYSFNGNPVIETPNIDRIAHEGVNFTQFYVTSPACSASRYSLMTGRYPVHSGFGSWVIGPKAKAHLRAEETTLADGLKAQGYATAMFGKWHMGNPNSSNKMSPAALPLAHGFDSWIGTNVSHDYSDAKLLRSDPSGNDPTEGYSQIAKNLPSDIEASTSLTGRYTRAAVKFIGESKDQPFFAYIAHNQPHLGLFVSDDFKGKSRRGLLGDVMAEVDDSVGQILKALEDAGIEKNTMVIFSSDNGPWVRFRDVAESKYGEARTHVGYALPFRDGKGSCWEGGHRTPGIFHWAGTIKPKRELSPASTLDILPTVFAITGAKSPDSSLLEGRDIRSLLLPSSEAPKPAEFEFYYSHSKNNMIAVRQGPWKLMVATPSQTGNQYGFKASEEKPLLFNVEEDIGERIDRAAEHPERVLRMRKMLREKRENSVH